MNGIKCIGSSGCNVIGISLATCQVTQTICCSREAVEWWFKDFFENYVYIRKAFLAEGWSTDYLLYAQIVETKS